MGLGDYIRRRGKRIAIAINCLMGAAMTYASVTYFNSNPHPDLHSRLGSVVIDLEQLGYGLKYEDLQSAGMFVGVGCRKCDLSRGGNASRLEDLENPQFMGTLYRAKARHLLWLYFYGEDVPAGQQHLEQSLQTLRAKFPGRGDAIRHVARGIEDNRRINWSEPPSPGAESERIQ